MGQGKFISENIGEIRFAIKTKRRELIQKLTSAEGSPEELGLSELADYASNKEGKDRIEAQLLWQRRMILSLTPLMFCLVGSAMMLRFNRGGRGFGILLALVTLIAYYLLTFFGEQLARTQSISVWEAGLIPIALTIVAILWFNLSSRIHIWGHIWERIIAALKNIRPASDNVSRRHLFVDLTTGLRDFDIVYNILRYFLLAFTFIGAIFLIFTAFELWKFAGTIDGGLSLLGKYLFFLVPFMYIQLAPSAAMIAILATYVIKSRQNEIVVWTSAGQSVYRLLMPAFLLMLVLGFINWEIQERILPDANQTQDELRMRIRSRGVLANQSGKLWVADDRRIYSFEPAKTTSSEPVIDSAYQSASDNVRPASISCPSQCVSDLAIYEFGADNAKMQAVYRSKLAAWDSDRIVFVGNVEKTDIVEGKSKTTVTSGGEFPLESNPFAEYRAKPSHMDTAEVREQIRRSASEQEQLNFTVALFKKYSTLALPLIIALFTAPFALSLSRKGKVITVGYAVGLWLLFTGITNVFEQFGLNGSLPPAIAIWAPLAAFAMLGVYLLTKVRT
jgi:lipopolysaccharide export system permease protein